MSNVPYYLDKARSGYGLGHGQLVDGILKDGLTDVYNNIHMVLLRNPTNDEIDTIEIIHLVVQSAK